LVIDYLCRPRGGFRRVPHRSVDHDRGEPGVTADDGGLVRASPLVAGKALPRAHHRCARDFVVAWLDVELAVVVTELLEMCRQVRRVVGYAPLDDGAAELLTLPSHARRKHQRGIIQTEEQLRVEV